MQILREYLPYLPSLTPTLSTKCVPREGSYDVSARPESGHKLRFIVMCSWHGRGRY